MDGQTVEFEKTAFGPAWVPAHAHVGSNVGATDTHALLTSSSERAEAHHTEQE